MSNHDNNNCGDLRNRIAEILHGTDDPQKLRLILVFAASLLNK